jgi:hypothetical protein
VAPQRKGVVPDAEARQLLAAFDAYEQARVARDAAIVAALKAGGSLRQVHALCGMAESHIQKIGHDGGWPTAKQKAARRAKAQDIASFHADIEAAQAHLREVQS